MGIIFSIFIAILWNLLQKRLWIACLGSTITSVLIALAIVTGSGHSPFYSDGFYTDIALLVGIVFGISSIVGFVFMLLRNKFKSKKL